MKGILVLLIVIFGSLNLTFQSGKEMGMITIGGILFALLSFIVLILIAVKEGRKVSYAEAGTEPVCNCVIIEGELIDDSDCMLHKQKDES